jgi:hypothetical protein
MGSLAIEQPVATSRASRAIIRVLARGMSHLLRGNLQRSATSTAETIVRFTDKATFYAAVVGGLQGLLRLVGA